MLRRGTEGHGGAGTVPADFDRLRKEPSPSLKPPLPVKTTPGMAVYSTAPGCKRHVCLVHRTKAPRQRHVQPFSPRRFHDLRGFEAQMQGGIRSPLPDGDAQASWLQRAYLIDALLAAPYLALARCGKRHHRQGSGATNRPVTSPQLNDIGSPLGCSSRSCIRSIR